MATMNKILPTLTVLATFSISISYGSGIFDRVLDDISSCVDVCTNTYSPHTYEKSYLMDSCKRGCRFFSIMEFIYDHECNFNLTQKGCLSSCDEAYNKTEEQDACNLGCRSQLPQAKKLREHAMSDDPTIHMMYPVMYVHNMYSNMVNKITHGMSISWSFYMQSENGRVIMVKSQPNMVNLGVDDGEDLYDDFNTANYKETNLEPVDRSATPVFRHYQVRPNQVDDDGLNLQESQPLRQSSDWLSCVSRKTGLPRLFLSLVLLGCAVMMIWLCLAATVTAPDQKVKEHKKLSIYGDLDYLQELEENGMKFTFPQTAEAGPLPVKLQINQV